METKLQEAYNSIPYQCVKDVILHNSGLEEEEINKKKLKHLFPLNNLSNFASLFSKCTC